MSALFLSCAFAACSSDAPYGSSAAAVTVNTNRLPPGPYTQGTSAIPSVLDDQYFLTASPWVSGTNALSYLWGYQDINPFSQYGALTLPAQEIIVAVVDTGVDRDHEDLAGRLWVNPVEGAGGNYNNNIDDDGDGFVDDFIGWDFANHTNNPADDSGHGTHVAGTIGAIGGNGKGIVGIAPWIRIMPVKVCNAQGSCDSSDIRAGIAYAVGHGAKIINLSLGAFNQGADAAAFEDAIREATDAGALVFAAAGNSATDVIQMTPASATFAVAVAAYRSDGEICSYSDFGWKIDLAAPGCGYSGGAEVSALLSLNSKKCGPSGSDYCQTSHVLGNDYALKQGTSMATPHAVGLAAIAWTASPDATPLQIRQALLRTARAQTAGKKDMEFGAGKVAAKIAVVPGGAPALNLVDEARTAPGLKITSPRYGASAATHTIGFRIEARHLPVSWTLKYATPPGADVSLSGGTQIAASTTDVSSLTSVNFTRVWVPPRSGDFVVVLEATAGGQTYHDVTLLHRD